MYWRYILHLWLFVGTMVNQKPNWVLVGHVGIIGHDRVLVSLSQSHYTNQGIKEMEKLSINIVDEKMLAKADYAGCFSGANTDKSNLFEYTIDDGCVPMVKEAPVSMECIVEDIYETEGFEVSSAKLKKHLLKKAF